MSISPVESFYSRLQQHDIPPTTPLSIVSCLKALEGLQIGSPESNAIQKLAIIVNEGKKDARTREAAQAIADMIVDSRLFGEIEREERDVFLKASRNSAYNITMRFLELGRMAWNRIRYQHGQSKKNQNSLCTRAVKNLQEVIKSLTKDESQKQDLPNIIADKFTKIFKQNNTIPGYDEFGKAFAKDIRGISKETYASWYTKLQESALPRRNRRPWGPPQREIKIDRGETQEAESKRPEWIQELIRQLQETLRGFLSEDDLSNILETLEAEWPKEIKENNDLGKANLHIFVLSLLGYEFQNEYNRVIYVQHKLRKGILPPNYDAATALLPQIEKALGITNIGIEDQEESNTEETTPPVQPEAPKRQRKRWEKPQQQSVRASEESVQPVPQERAQNLVKPISKRLSQKASSMMDKIRLGRFNSQTEKTAALSNEQWLEVVRECIEMARTDVEKQRTAVKVLNFIRDKLIPYLGEEKDSFKTSLEQISGLIQSDEKDLKTKTFRVAIGLRVSE